ncbi:hypothetical protein [Fimbriiglobus ruber]|uniref:Uncharacterized protein n=1 Tax=Fimbriiglobus ruber TaxID=1908690 RepID=A0A225DPG0_9BACT|nr:hypothetical protein [Fimbriiglobus ruber]OWK40478.1 hypothetical protein FRUB_05397 [Fimbriiglobus ruber]
MVCGERRSCVPDATQVVQPFPANGVLFDNLDLRKPELEDQISGLPGTVRSYKMISVYPDDQGQFEQRGSGPNFQGGCLTLCTCAHQIRAEKKFTDEWEGSWLAGFTSPRLCGRTWLFYLAQVERVYPTAASHWAALPANLRQAKTTRRNRLGDAFQPNIASSCADPFDAAHYHTPMVKHSHHMTATDDTWKNDIEFFNSLLKRHSVYLVAKPEFTFLWHTPTLFLKDHPRNQSWESVDDLLVKLKVKA